MSHEPDRIAAHVEPSGASYVANLGVAMLRKASVGPMDNNAYLITCRTTGQQLLVDAAADPDRLEALVQEGSGRLDLVVTTHRHRDHTAALREIVERYSAATSAGAADAAELPVWPDHRLEHGDTVRIGEVELDVIGLRGHTPGSVALVLTDAAGGQHLLTGDSLFPGGPGRTASPADFTSLMTDLSERVFDAYPDDTAVHPGHGDSTTLGAERGNLPDWWARGW